MSELLAMTKKNLLVIAKDMEIEGRHDMTKDELIEALEEAGYEGEDDGEGEGEDNMAAVFEPGKSYKIADELSPEEMEELKNAVEDEMKTGKRLVKNTNIPWRRKYYYLDADVYGDKTEELKKAPSQVQLILKSMLNDGCTTEEDSMQGGPIVQNAIASGLLKTKIESHVLFAYYRSKMENLGLVFAGYNMSED